ncbi:MAG TPA: MG2 domain-containing protein, partial [Candidatus Binataceae bacterium]|nr:MG2 domain-containing protein [Candidatus Binataceae bacterium]
MRSCPGTSRIRIFFSAFFLFFAAPAFAANSATITRFSPRGYVKSVRQVTARFSQAMVPLGDPRVKISPFDIQCSEPGTARWIDSFTWSYDFKNDLPGGVRCTFNLHPGLKTLGGQPVAGTNSFSFDTGGPSILDSRPWSSNDSIDEQQAFVLMLDTPADEASVVQNTTFSVEGIAERVGVSMISPADRAILAKRFARAIDKRPFVILQARQHFPNGAKVTLVWGKGIKSSSGVANREDQTLDFTVRKVFKAKVSCDRENEKAGCIPLTPITVNFTADISADLARSIALVAPDGTRVAPKLEDTDQINSIQFPGPFKELTQYKVVIPDHFVDDSGRTLSNASQFPYPVQVDHFPPLAKFSARFGIIESVDPVLPVTVRNLEAEIHGAKMKLDPTAGHATGFEGLVTRVTARLFQLTEPDPKSILTWLRRVAEARRADSVFEGAPDANQTAFALPKPNGPQAFEVMGIPLKARGLFVVELKSEKLGAALLGENKPMYVPTSALVTNLAVHFKQGRANSLIWVTELENARPVSGAEVAIADCNGAQIWSGSTDSRGIALVPKLPALDNPPNCNSDSGADTDRETDYYSDQTDALRDLSGGVLVTARHHGDFSFVHSSWKNGIESWRFHLPTEYQPTQATAHTVFDRVLLRAGETVHMKHFIRTRTLDGFGVPEPDRLPDTVTISHVGDDKKYNLKLTWNADGTASNDWTIPVDAKLGEYDVSMTMRSAATASPAPGDDSGLNLDSGSFHVEQFRIPVMKAAIKLPADPQVAVSLVPVDVSIAYLSGGAARGLPVVLRSQISPVNYQTLPDFQEFTFANGPVKEGVFKSEQWEEGTPEANPGVHQTTRLTLDNAGGARSAITGIPRSDIPQDIRAEIEFRDANGEIKTAANDVTVWPARLLPGIRTEDWISSPNFVRAQIAVVDDNGKPAADVPVQVTVLTEKYLSYRKRLVGGFYAYENTREVKQVGGLCAGRTDDRGLFFCEGKPAVSGQLTLQVSVKDDAGNASSAHASVYVPGDNRMWFESHDDDRIDVVPEKPEYQPGETARFQVRIPFAESTALVTVEREGIIAASVVRLSGKDPIVTLPVRDYAPNAFVSVLAVRGRVAGIMPTSTIDLGKPAFRLGIAGIRVGWHDHRLAVTVTPDRTVYRVREKARVKVAVRAPDGGKPPAGSTVALAAVDEGLLELMPNDSWKLLEAMMGQRSYQVETSTASMQVVGRRHFGLKAIPPGGGGGSRVTRELFDTLLLWNPSVQLDDNGDAVVEVPLNDSLTSFRIVAIAAASTGDFGTGASSIRSTQDLQLYSGVAPIARTGDSFPAQFTVRNASDKPYDVNITGSIEGLATKPPPMTISLAPGDGKTVAWDVAVPLGPPMLKYDIAASAQGASDHLRVSQQILPSVPVRTWQATLLQLDKPFSQPIAIPSDAIAGQGGVQIDLSPSLTAGLGSIEAWMREYPYVCMEQRVSRAVALHDANLWKGIVADMPSYLDSDGLLKYFPSMRDGSDVLTSYVLAISNEAGLALPGDAQDSMQSALDNFIQGKLTRSEPFAVVDLPMRKLAAIEALSRYGKATAPQVSTLTIDPNLWPDSAVIDWWSILSRTPQLPKRDERMTQVQQIMRARINEQGTAMHLSSDPRNNLWWLMVSPERDMVRLLLVLLDSGAWHGDVPRLMRGALALQQKGAWPSTIANAWGVLAINKFAATFESQPVAGQTVASIASQSKQLDWAHDPKGGQLGFEWPPSAASLDLTHRGSGAPWAQVSTRAAIPLKAPFSSGYTI